MIGQVFKKTLDEFVSMYDIKTPYNNEPIF